MIGRFANFSRFATGAGWLALLLIAVLSATSASAQSDPPKITVKDPTFRKIPIAVTQFAGDSGEMSDLGAQISQVIMADLDGSGLFDLTDPRAFIQSQISMNTTPRFREWRQMGAEAMVQGRIMRVNGGRMRVEFRLWDVTVGTQLIGQAFSTDVANWRRVAHIVADAVYKRMTGEDGYFDTRIVYIAESGPATKRVKKLAIMDQDGANHRFLTDGSSLVLTPRFSPTLQEVTYVSYDRDVARVYIYNIESGKRELLGQFPDMTFAPRFTPDGNGVILSMSREGNADIFTMDLRTRRIRRLTFHDAIDTSPSFSPDGRYIVFNSDRDGSQQLYVMSAQGGDARRISFGNGRYATPVWSPRGDFIAYTKMLGGQFYVGVMKPDGSGERELTGGFLVESPTWAPNGRVLMFFRENRGGAPGSRSNLFTIDLTGRNERLIRTPQDASDPAWSPLIP